MYQKHILDLLRTTPSLRYSQLQPDGVESSHFRYHLLQLQKDDLITRTEDGNYSLSSRGLAVVDKLSENRINPHQTPKVITYTLLFDDDNYYLYRKPKAPYRATLNMIAGKLHIGESAASASAREVHEKIDLDITPPHARAVANIRIIDDGQIITHIIAYIFDYHLNGGHVALEAIPRQSIADRTDLAPDFLQIVNSLDNDNFKNLDIAITL